jgi:hypothetical protein
MLRVLGVDYWIAAITGTSVIVIETAALDDVQR